MQERTAGTGARRAASPREGTATPHRDKSPRPNPHDTHKLNALIQRGERGPWRGEGGNRAGPGVGAVSPAGLSTPGGPPAALAAAPGPAPSSRLLPEPPGAGRAGRCGTAARPRSDPAGLPGAMSTHCAGGAPCPLRAPRMLRAPRDPAIPPLPFPLPFPPPPRQHGGGAGREGKGPGGGGARP